MRRKLALLGFALLATAGTFVLQPRPTEAAEEEEASSCFCADPDCCNWCCPVGNRLLCTERPCPA